MVSSTLEAGRRPRMDPRIARRRVEVRREEGRRRLRLLAWGSGAAVVVLLAVGSLWTPLFAVRHVEVSTGPAAPAPAGVPTMTGAQVVRAAGFTHRRLMVDVDGAKVAARLDAVPLLGAAHVSVRWPGTVKISVIERVPVAAVAVPAAQGAPARWAVVDATGRVLALAASAPAGLPVVYGISSAPPAGGWVSGSPGPGAPVTAPSAGSVSRSLVDMNAASDSPDAPRGLAAALALAAALPQQIRGDVQSITIGRPAGPTGGARPSVAAGGLSLSVLPARVASGSITVALGDGSQLAAKLTALQALLVQADLNGVTGIDLTVPDRPAALTAR